MCRRFDPAPNHFQSEALLPGAGLFFSYMHKIGCIYPQIQSAFVSCGP